MLIQGPPQAVSANSERRNRYDTRPTSPRSTKRTVPGTETGDSRNGGQTAGFEEPCSPVNRYEVEIDSPCMRTHPGQHER